MISMKVFTAYSVRLSRIIGRKGGLMPDWLVDQWQAGFRFDIGYYGPF